MKILKYFCAVVLLFASNESTAQYVEFGTDKIAFKKFQSTIKLEVVLTGNQDFDNALENAISSNWKIKPFEFIDSARFARDISNNTYCFITAITRSVYVPESGTFYGSELIIFNGDDALKNGLPSKGGLINETIASAPFDTHGIDNKITEAQFKLNFMVRGMNDGLKLVESKKIKGSGAKFRMKYCKTLSQSAISIKDKTLLIIKDLNYDRIEQGYSSVGHATSVLEEVMKNYPFKFKYVSVAEFEDILNNHEKGYCFFNPCMGTARNIIVFDIETFEPLYIKLTYLYSKKHFVDDLEINDLVSAINGKYKTGYWRTGGK